MPITHCLGSVPDERDCVEEAIKRSRRTILVVSPGYVTWNLTSYEILSAQLEMLKRRHAIVTIIFRDVSESRLAGHVDPQLCRILDTFPCHRWPDSEDIHRQDKFWNRLRVYLPKKKPAEQQADEAENGQGDTCV